MTGGPPIAGLILAGGLARRMGGGDKGLKQVGGRPVLDWVVERAKAQTAPLILNAGGDPNRFKAYGLPVVEDVVPGAQGPLAGILTGLDWLAQHHPGIEWMVSFTTDAPFIPRDLAQRLWQSCEERSAELACAVSNGRTHPVFGLWRVGLRADLRDALVGEEMRKIDRWTARYALAEVEFDTHPVDPFFNINRPEDLAEAEELLTAKAIS
ncbi:MAG: molybdenum cofactor guanylyltransferase MobA [Magnetovibrionaceae bacterium]